MLLSYSHLFLNNLAHGTKFVPLKGFIQDFVFGGGGGGGGEFNDIQISKLHFQGK